MIEYQDQDILNGVLQANVHYISPKYNFMPEYRTILKPNYIWMLDKLPYTKSEIDSLRSDAIIYNYCDKRKAWMYSCTHDGFYLYLKYQLLTYWVGVVILIYMI
ncbi:glycosyltransferase [Aliivibrio fischeri]|uniref:glycosyltransferase n=1 Tax=Aliivibrio fischeri TaxID=668 RepID=UPI003AF7D555